MLIAGRYRLLDLVGRGGMGRVWRARDEMLHREVAVKEIVPPSWLADPERAELRSRTLREARAAARLNHPAVVRLYDVVPVDGSPWIVMEYVPSRTLQDVVDDEGPLEPARAARIGLAVLDALQAAHTAGVLHRDVKPQNVLVAHDGRVMLTDFGLATFDGGDGAMTRPGMVLGSPQYVAPERAAEGVSTVAADLWSLGATLHAAVEGRSPYARSTAMATLSALAAGPPDPAPHAGPLAPVLAGLLRRDPRDRLDHETARRLLTEAATGRTEPPPATDRPRSAAGRADGTPPWPPTSPTRTSPSRCPSPTPRPHPANRRPPPPDLAHRARHGGRRWSPWRYWWPPSPAWAPRWPSPPTSPPAPPPGPPAAAVRRRTGWPVRSGARPPRPPPGGRGCPRHRFPASARTSSVRRCRPARRSPGETLRPPPGWVWHADTSGFRVSVPATWRYSRDGTAACFQDPETGRAFSVAEGGPADPLVRLRTARDAAAGAGALPGYDEILLAASDRGAEWECRWRAPDGPWLHARQHVVGAGRWTLGWITDDADWASAGADWAEVRDSFRAPH